MTSFKVGRYTLIDYLTGFEMGHGATNGCKSGQPASKRAGLRIGPEHIHLLGKQQDKQDAS